MGQWGSEGSNLEEVVQVGREGKPKGDRLVGMWGVARDGVALFGHIHDGGGGGAELVGKRQN